MRGSVQNAIQQLKDDGYDLNITHYRMLDSVVRGYQESPHCRTIMADYIAEKTFREITATPSGLGGRTIVTVTRRDGQGELTERYVGVSTVNPFEQFNRKLGLRIALGRALKEMESAL